MLKKQHLPYFFISIILIIIITTAAIFAKNKKDSHLTNNIDDSSIIWSSYEEKHITLSDSLIITSPGVYVLTGEIVDGFIEVDTTGVLKIILDNVSINNSNGPAILVSEAKTAVIETAKDSVNNLSDSSSYSLSDTDISATIFSKDDLVLQGSGKIILTGNYEDGIASKDDLKITSGSYEIISKDEGIRGRDSVYISGGTFLINSGGDGIKSNNSEEVGKGTILIDNGEISISAGDDGIHAESSLEINGGIVSIKESKEGLEGANIIINDGEMDIAASDDGVNAAGGNDASAKVAERYNSSTSNYSIIINGGKLHVNSLGDGLDSNGSLTINGGEVVVDGPSNSANGALDSETGILYNGGSIIALGASGMATAPVENSSKLSISAFLDKTYPAGTKISVKDSLGNVLLSHVSEKAFSHAVLSSESFEKGKTYTILLNDSEYTSVTLDRKTTRSGSGAQIMGPGDLKFQKER